MIPNQGFHNRLLTLESQDIQMDSRGRPRFLCHSINLRLMHRNLCPLSLPFTFQKCEGWRKRESRVTVAGGLGICNMEVGSPRNCERRFQLHIQMVDQQINPPFGTDSLSSISQSTCQRVNDCEIGIIFLLVFLHLEVIYDVSSTSK